MSNHSKKTVLVTGASSGIGYATAKLLAEQGYIVYAGARRLDSMKPLEEFGVKTLELDVTDKASRTAVMAKVGVVDVLINNAGYGLYGPIEEVSLGAARSQLETNVFGLVAMTQLVLPVMREQGSGTIVNIGSVAGRFGSALGGWYHASKYAVEGLSDSLALEVAPFGVNVIVVEPGVIKTAWSGVASDGIKGEGKGVYGPQIRQKSQRLQRFNETAIASDPEVVARKISWVLKRKNPRFRYAVGGGASALVLLRRILPERWFYWIIKQRY